METPLNLKHTPIIHVQNYDDRDAQYTNETDAKFLSVGFSQWTNGEENEDRSISVKVGRYDNENGKWSRQSEELPIHRVIDLSILLLASLIKDKNTNTLSRFCIELLLQ